MKAVEEGDDICLPCRREMQKVFSEIEGDELGVGLFRWNNPCPVRFGPVTISTLLRPCPSRTNQRLHHFHGLGF